MVQTRQTIVNCTTRARRVRYPIRAFPDITLAFRQHFLLTSRSIYSRRFRDDGYLNIRSRRRPIQSPRHLQSIPNQSRPVHELQSKYHEVLSLLIRSLER